VNSDRVRFGTVRSEVRILSPRPINSLAKQNKAKATQREWPFAFCAAICAKRLTKPICGDQARQGRITEINGFHIEAIPQGYMLVMRNRDVPGVIGRVGTILGERGVNISRFHLGRRERGGEAMAVIEVDAPIEKDTLNALRDLNQVVSAVPIEL
jgi:hypothetical protein